MAEKPKRIQRRRAKGWKMPPNTVSITRPGKFGNPFRNGTSAECVYLYKRLLSGWAAVSISEPTLDEQRRTRFYVADNIKRLRGKNLACWCELCSRHADGKPFDVTCSECAPCHADVLLEIANG